MMPRLLLLILLSSSAAASVVVACTSIVGVEDVRLRSDDGGVDPPLDGGAVDASRTNVTEVALGELHTCARRPTGTVRCWGDDTQGQTGTGGTVADAGLVITPAYVEGITDARSIAAGRSHSCIVHATGRVACWGYNFSGQLGDGSPSPRSTVPVSVNGIDDALRVAAGGNFTCVLRESGGVSCWGGNEWGQLGDDSKQARNTADAVRNLDDAIAISAGETHACAVRRGGTVACWGNGTDGQLGNGNAPSESRLPLDIPSLSGVIGVATGQRSSCALKSDKTLVCWGANDLGQLGSGSPSVAPNPSPAPVDGISDATALWAGASHACAVRSGGGVRCWGAGEWGQLGDGAFKGDAATASPVDVVNVAGAVGVGTGGNHSCAATQAGTVVCWGENTRGQLGEGTQTPQPTARDVRE